MNKSQDEKSGFLKNFFTLSFLALPFLLAIVYELKTNEIEATFFSWYSQDITWEINNGKSNCIVFPLNGPYDSTMGYSRLPDFQKQLDDAGYVISRQARQSQKIQSLLKKGIAIPYDKKPAPGLRLNDKDGSQIYYVNLNTEQFPSFQTIPPLLVKLLLHRENRELLNYDRPFLNPAIEWDRFALAFLNYVGEKFFGSSGGMGGSTLATQLIKFRHSSKGMTSAASDKLKQMAGASIWSYQKNPNTIEVRRQIIKEYLNGMPLGAAPGYGEINGIGNGMWAWYGKTMNQLTSDLTLPETSPDKIYQKARTLKEAFSLIIATRYPSFYLQNDPAILDKKVTAYFRLLERDKIISPELTKAVVAIPLTFKPGAPFPPPVCLLRRKGMDALRTNLLNLLGIKTLYELDRLDLTVDTTLDFETQQKVNTIFNSLYDQGFLKEQGFISPYILNTGDPGKVIYSIALFESRPEGNLLRVQSDTLDRPLNISTGIKLELGSTAKLRTLTTYLMIIDRLDDYFSTQNPSSREPLPDTLSKWVAEYRLLHPKATREEVLKAGLQREISADPHQEFFTGGGLHVFKNFKKEQDAKMYTIEEGLCQSVNLVFIRLLKEVVDYYIAELGYDEKGLLADPNHPGRIPLLKEAAELEAIDFLKKFYRIHQSKSYAESLDLLCQSRKHPLRNWMLLYLKENPAATFNQLETHAKARFWENALDLKYLNKLFRAYRGKSFSFMDEAYLLGKHPLETWLINYFKDHPHAPWTEVLEASKKARELSSSWLFKSSFQAAQNLRIKTMLEKKAFAEIHRNWKLLGYPFGSLVPSLATTIGSSADRPANLAELMGIILNEGVYKPAVSVQGLHFAQSTPYETHFIKSPSPGKKVMSSEVARILKMVLKNVVDRGTAQRIKNTFVNPDGTPLEIGGKTGTGDNRFETFRRSADELEVTSSKILSRTSSFVFFVDRYFGIVTAHVEGPEASNYSFTSALAVQVLKTLWPALEPLFQKEPPRTS
ncbi:MAG TPA: transglycosylase domain-containing protein [Thermodesulfobacteriota bacterium]|nr:transglycosylase domain-containing protein [Thermodesulfobacteriota bacterium]